MENTKKAFFLFYDYCNTESDRFWNPFFLGFFFSALSFFSLSCSSFSALFPFLFSFLQLLVDKNDIKYQRYAILLFAITTTTATTS